MATELYGDLKICAVLKQDKLPLGLESAGQRDPASPLPIGDS